MRRGSNRASRRLQPSRPSGPQAWGGLALPRPELMRPANEHSANSSRNKRGWNPETRSRGIKVIVMTQVTLLIETSACSIFDTVSKTRMVRSLCYSSIHKFPQIRSPLKPYSVDTKFRDSRWLFVLLARHCSSLYFRDY